WLRPLSLSNMPSASALPSGFPKASPSIITTVSAPITKC
ncbi:hypothetical protein X975_15246, partial [Stegodyphus mimosarum]